MDLRPYQPADRESCLALCEPAVRPAFQQFLDDPGTYFVMEHEGEVVGCGGYSVDPAARQASLLWGMVRPDMRLMGLGRFLLMFRLREIGRTDGLDFVRVETGPEWVRFFEKQGFKTGAAGPERVEMIKKMAVCT